MTEHELRIRFPRASEDFIAAQLGAGGAGDRAGAVKKERKKVDGKKPRHRQKGGEVDKAVCPPVKIAIRFRYSDEIRRDIDNGTSTLLDVLTEVFAGI